MPRLAGCPSFWWACRITQVPGGCAHGSGVLGSYLPTRRTTVHLPPELHDDEGARRPTADRAHPAGRPAVVGLTARWRLPTSPPPATCTRCGMPDLSPRHGGSSGHRLGLPPRAPSLGVSAADVGVVASAPNARTPS